MKRFISVATALAAVAIVGASCGGKAATPTTTTPTSLPTTTAPTTTVVQTTTMKREAAVFLRIVSPFNSETTTIDLSDAKPMTTAGLQAFLAPLGKVSNALVGSTLSAGFTGQAATAARTMAIAAEAIVADIQSVTASNWTSERAIIVRDEGTVGSEGRVIRADLGIPAAK